MGGFKSFLNEKSLINILEAYKIILILEKELVKLKNHNLIWRGFKGAKGLDGLNIIKNDRPNFYGGVYPKSKEILDCLKIKHVVFGTNESIYAQFYGTPHIVVPIGKFKVFSSETVNDIMVAGDPLNSSFKDKSAKEIAKEFEPKALKNAKEILIDCEEYGLIDVVKVFDIIPNWIKDKMQFISSAQLTKEEDELLTAYRYNPEKVQKLKTDDEQTYNKYKAAELKTQISSEQRVGISSAFRADFHFNEKLKTYDDLLKYMNFFKSYIEFMKNKKGI